jgi:hypothetical protein
MMTHDEMIKVIAAHRDGADVEFQDRSGPWSSTVKPLWDFLHNQYRVKTEPLICWANVYSTGAPLFHYTKEEADANSMPNRIRCAKMVEEAQS